MQTPSRSHEPDAVAWLQRHFPEVSPLEGWPGEVCWVEWALTQSTDHNPPFFWLGHAFDIVAAAGQADHFGDRLRSAHGPQPCSGRDSRDGRLQDVLTELCAFAWTAERIAVPVPELAVESAPGALGPIRLHVHGLDHPDREAFVVPRRLQPVRSMDEVIEQIAGQAREASSIVPSGRGVLYLDAWHDRRYAQGIGYRLERTEPVRSAVRHFALEYGLGYVLTRPFEWGRAIEEWF